MALHVLSSGPLTTVQDLGRPGYERFGIPQSGAMDWFALRAANHLVGNPPGSAALEFVAQAPELCANEDYLVAAAGRGFLLQINERNVGAWRCALVRRGETIHFATQGEPGWGTLAISGGIDVPLVMGSRSTYLRGGFGGFMGRALQPGDDLAINPFDTSVMHTLVGRSLPFEYRIRYSSQGAIPVILGPQAEMFGEAGLGVFLSAEYRIEAASDRMGYRLSGPAVPRLVQSELLSEGTAPGSVQVPPDGQPLVLLSDRPATGGYAKIATLARVGLPVLVQALPGSGRVRFLAVGVEEAQERYRLLVEGIAKGAASDED